MYDPNTIIAMNRSHQPVRSQTHVVTDRPSHSVGDRVFWTDPDDGLCSGVGTVVAVGNNWASLIMDSGAEVDAPTHELKAIPTHTEYRRTAEDVARIVLASPDGTFTLDGERVQEADGFEVGGYDPHMPLPVVRPGQNTRQALARRVRALRQWPAPPRIGKWTDVAGRVHLDATRWFPGRRVAMDTAFFLEQEAIYDWATGECPEVDS